MAILLARVCWNENGWRGPTGGQYGKESSYVGENGFGHEEWNLNTTDTMNGLVYGYIYYSPPYTSDLYEERHDIYFYTISPAKERLIVGFYEKAIFIDEELREEIRRIYEESGVLAKRVDELVALELPPISTRKKAKQILSRDFAVNLYVEPENVHSFQPPIKITKKDIGGKEPKYLSRYASPNFLSNPPSINVERRMVKKRSKGTRGALIEDSYVRFSKSQRIVIDGVHRKLSNRFRSWLKSIEAKDIIAEKDCVDMECKYYKERYLFEIKHCYKQSARHAIREALGQLLQYAYYPGSDKVDRLGIVVDISPNAEDLQWFKNLKSKKIEVELFFIKGELLYSPRITGSSVSKMAKLLSG